jgi:hypothetical protein
MVTTRSITPSRDALDFLYPHNTDTFRARPPAAAARIEYFCVKPSHGSVCLFIVGRIRVDCIIKPDGKTDFQQEVIKQETP